MMNTGMTRTTCLLLALALLASQQAVAVTVYQWTDEEGVVHYSDTPPSDEEVTSEVNDFVLFDYEGDEVVGDEYSIVNQLERMTEWRRQAEEDRRAWRQLQLEEERLAQEQQYFQPVAEVSTDSYLPYNYYPSSYYPRAYNHRFPGNFPRFNNRHDHHFPDMEFNLGARGPHQSYSVNKNFGRR